MQVPPVFVQATTQLPRMSSGTAVGSSYLIAAEGAIGRRFESMKPGCRDMPTRRGESGIAACVTLAFQRSYSTGDRWGDCQTRSLNPSRCPWQARAAP